MTPDQTRAEQHAARNTQEHRPHPSNCLCRHCAEDNAGD